MMSAGWLVEAGLSYNFSLPRLLADTPRQKTTARQARIFIVHFDEITK
jgi:hypothetical protein